MAQFEAAWEQVLIDSGHIPPRATTQEMRTSAPRRANNSATPKESEIQRAIIGYLGLCGAIAIRVNSGGMYAGKKADGSKRYIAFNDAQGCSDILACLPGGTFAAIEVKRPGKVAKPHQQSFLDWVSSRGGLALVVHSVEELANALRSNGFYAP